jgi:hypothetical protein
VTGGSADDVGALSPGDHQPEIGLVDEWARNCALDGSLSAE